MIKVCAALALCVLIHGGRAAAQQPAPGPGGARPGAGGAFRASGGVGFNGKNTQDQLAAIRDLLGAGDDESQREKVEAARKKFEKVKIVHIEHSKRLREAFAKLSALDPQSAFGGMGGMGGTMGGMGGGMR